MRCVAALRQAGSRVKARWKLKSGCCCERAPALETASLSAGLRGSYQFCGAHIHVSGASGNGKVRIVYECPGTGRLCCVLIDRPMCLHAGGVEGPRSQEFESGHSEACTVPLQPGQRRRLPWRVYPSALHFLSLRVAYKHPMAFASFCHVQIATLLLTSAFALLAGRAIQGSLTIGTIHVIHVWTASVEQCDTTNQSPAAHACSSSCF